MHDTQQDPVNVGQMIAWIADGETPEGQQKIGTEHEKFLFHRQTLAPVAYQGEAGIGVLLERLLTDLGPGAEPIMENGNIIGIVDADGGAVTLEPGGQLELSGAPLDNIAPQHTTTLRCAAPFLNRLCCCVDFRAAND